MTETLYTVLDAVSAAGYELVDAFSTERMRTRAQAAATVSVLMWTAPMTVTAALTTQVVNKMLGGNESPHLLPEDQRRTVLLTEVGIDPRTLYVARALGKAGHRVVVVSGDENNVVKASRYVDKFYRVPRETRSYYGANFGREYIRNLVAICKDEEVNWIVPIGDGEGGGDMQHGPAGSCSTAAAVARKQPVETVSNAAVGQILSSLSNLRIKSLSNHRNPQVEYIMSNKLFFMTECKALRLPVPEFHVVENTHELKQLHRRGVFASGEKFCLKPLDTLRTTPAFLLNEGSSREDVSNVPINEGIASFESFIQTGMGSAVSETNPHMLYQCVSGFHLTVNTVISSGNVVWFDFTASTVDFSLNSGPVVEWINSFSAIKQLNGFMTFLFIIDVKKEEAFCVDCRPTISHNILKKHSNSQMLSLEQAIRTALDEEAVTPLAFSRNQTPRSSLRSSRRKIVAGKDRIMTRVAETTTGAAAAVFKDSAGPVMEAAMSASSCPATPGATGEVVSLKRPSYVYWLPQELLKVLSQEQSVMDFLNILVNGKEANWDSDDPAPYIVSHVMHSPKTFFRSIITGRRPTDYYEPF